MYFVYGVASNQFSNANLADGVAALTPMSGYLGGAAVKSYSSTLGTLTHALHLGAINYRGTTQNFISATIAAIAIYSTTLSAADVAALTARMQAL